MLVKKTLACCDGTKGRVGSVLCQLFSLAAHKDNTLAGLGVGEAGAIMRIMSFATSEVTNRRDADQVLPDQVNITVEIVDEDSLEIAGDDEDGSRMMATRERIRGFETELKEILQGRWPHSCSCTIAKTAV